MELLISLYQLVVYQRHIDSDFMDIFIESQDQRYVVNRGRETMIITIRSSATYSITYQWQSHHC